MVIEISREIRGLIFDCDGTLADSMPLHMRAWEKAFLEFGEPYRPDFLEPLSGMNEEDIVSLYNERFHRRIDPRELVDLKQTHFRKGAHRVEPVRPVVDVAVRYRDLLPMAVVSGGRRENVLLTLAGLGIDRLFSAVLTADDPFPPKPAPDLFLEAARRMTVPPGLCHVFEDGQLGLVAASRAGMTATNVSGYSRANRDDQ